VETIKVNEVNLAYGIAGEGEPILLIHGGVLADSFAGMLKQVSLKDFQTIHYHRRGHGLSGDFNGQTDYKQQAADALALLNHAGINRAHLVGHSFGGGIALQLAIDAPEFVQSLVLLEGLMPLPDNFAPPPSFGPLPMESINSQGIEQLGDIFMTRLLGPNWENDLSEFIENPEGQVIRGIKTTMFQERDMFFGRVTVKAYEKVTQPVLWVSGDQPLMSIAEPMPGLMRKMIPQTEFKVINGVGHALQIARPEDVAEIIADYLRKYPIR
jgi:pimeloyl-ACP methyl ester carboxylesterase